jgi:hypothetical protein
MKTLAKNYIFNPSLRQITLSDLATIKLNRVLLVTNVTNNTIIYNFANPLLGGSVSGNVLTLDLDVTAMSSTDDLQIFYDTEENPAGADVMEALYMLVDLLAFLPAVRGSLADLRVTPTGTVNVAGTATVSGSLTTLTTLTNMAQMGGQNLNTVPKSFDNQLAVLGNINNVTV